MSSGLHRSSSACIKLAKGKVGVHRRSSNWEDFGVLATTTLATSMAARQGPVPMAGHQICFQVWMALSLLNDALALAGQTLLASDYSQGNYGQASKVAYKVLQISMVMGVALAVILFSSFDALSSLFSTDSGVQKIARSGTWERKRYSGKFSS
ncbi:unnamed protein product [Fraxinus pennsylvanica]|uniref:Protein DETOXIFICATION n=1 Tax=Fraxinus pennsylvanica TaxID=56036 RepID=A0AAD1ZT15_9LAMI|nr:unnamed protein product [Fraxinus pennsylvanica]